MRAIYLTHHFQNAEEIQLPITERPLPKIKERECLVQISSAGINPSDALGAIGYFAHAKLPRIPGRDFAGIIIEGNKKFIGKKVWGTGGAAGLDFDGTHAEYIVIPESAIAEIPHTVSLLQAGVQTLPYVTAYYSLITRGRLRAGETVLVIGALGQVGHAAMAICKWKHAKPIALVRGETLQAAKDLGWESYDSIPEQSFDLILNTVGNVYWDGLTPKLKKFGRIVTIAAPEGKRDVSLNLFSLYRENQDLIGINTVDLPFAENAKFLDEMKEGFESGDLTPLAYDATTIFPLEKAQEAYKMALSKGSGKRIALEINPAD